jgi:sulfate transport system substrate-binding protein
MAVSPSAWADTTLLNVSYDPTRELYREINAAFTAQWQRKTGERVSIRQSHGGSGKQARAVMDGLDADVVTLALAYDVDAIVRRTGGIAQNWKSRLPHNSAPYTSTIVFVVRNGNPKNIIDWDDVVKPGTTVIVPNPKTSGGARWIYLAAWGYALRKHNGVEARAQSFMARLFGNVPVMDVAARGAATTFAQRGLGDVLLTWENEALLLARAFPAAGLQMVVPSMSILAEPPVCLVDAHVDRHGTREVTEAYLQFLYSPAAQSIAARHGYRPRLETALRNAGTFQALTLFTVDELFGGWAAAQAKHFDDGGVFDKLYRGGAYP